jgi:ABC-type transport system involved in multi-copper enzyme maturation permease subunit
MIRLAWRQFRGQVAVGAFGLVAIAIVTALTGPHLAHLYDTNVANCSAHGDCSTATTAFLTDDSTLRTWLGILVVVVPGIIGLFWGAPLVARELEAGTHRLVWTQSVSRTRWLSVKFSVTCLAAMVTTGVLSLLVTWWASPLDRAKGSLYSTFAQRDIVPLGYTAFALALGVTAGLLIRRTIPAMAATLVAFVALLLAVGHWIRPRLITPTTEVLGINPQTTGFGSANGGPFTLVPNLPNLPNGWIYSAQFVDRAGHTLAPAYVASACRTLIASAQAGGGGPAADGHSSRVPTPAGAQAQLQACFSRVGATFHDVVAYQPAGHYWTFQWYELGIYLVAALVLVGFSAWWVRRRLT